MKNVCKKSIPFVLGAAMAITVLPAFGSVMVQDVPVISGSTAEAAAVKSWDFSKNIGGWMYAGGYAYSGDASAAYDSSFGGSMKVDVDYSVDKAQGWSEVKLADMNVTKAAPIVAGAGIKSMSFDFYFDPAQVTGDSALKAKVFAMSVKDSEVINQPIDDLGLAKAKAVPGTNLKVAHVKVLFDDEVKADIAHLELSIVSYLTGYKGAIYINNIQMK